MPVGVIGFLAILTLAVGVAAATAARWRTLTVLAGVMAAIAGACILTPWQSYQEYENIRGADWVTVDRYTGLEWFEAVWALAACVGACAGAVALATADAPPTDRRRRLWGSITLLLLAAVGAFAVIAALSVDHSVYESSRTPIYPGNKVARRGVAEAGLFLTILASTFGFICMVGVVVRKHVR